MMMMSCSTILSHHSYSVEVAVAGSYNHQLVLKWFYNFRFESSKCANRHSRGSQQMKRRAGKS